MSELPPDLPRLRAILAYLDRQITDNETVGIYLQLRREAARKALAAAEQQAATSRQRRSGPRRPASSPAAGPGSGKPGSGKPGSAVADSGKPGSGKPPATGYVIEPKKHPAHPLPALYHLADCTMIQRRTSPITPHQIRLGLRDPLGILAPCEFCAPDKGLEPAG
ncbi:DUF6233 domain-containing protein [Streptomyces sp. NPDC020362]|uniref:DUF6233 domain-containing protein n=1 Tax=unclassified Streptomyces TaxID=2593676 RepID=UPI000B114D8D